ncbi:MAG: hypothetical protein WAT81_02125 [Candidatus Moraniibacteriota bacterium]
MNQLSFSLSLTPSFVSSEPRYFSGGSGGAPTVSTSPFATPAFDRVINLVVLALVVGTPLLPFLGR